MFNARAVGLLPVALVAVLGLGGLTAAPAFAGCQDYPPTQCEPTPTPTPSESQGNGGGQGGGPVSGPPTVESRETSVAPGDELTLTGDNWAKKTAVQLELHSRVTYLGTTTTNGSGHFRAVVVIPADTEPGEHHIVALGKDAQGSSATADMVITVEEGSRALPRTGRDLVSMLLVGLALLATGLAAFFAGRRHRLGPGPREGSAA